MLYDLSFVLTFLARLEELGTDEWNRGLNLQQHSSYQGLLCTELKLDSNNS